MKIIDAFCFFNEADLCTIRLNYYKDVVDHFVILESTHTWRGTRNKPNFMKTVWPNLNKKIRDKIHHKILDHPDEWLNEESWHAKLVQDKMRDNLVYEAREVMDGEDAYFFYNDLDEFWDKRKLPTIQKALDEHRYVVCWQDYRIVYVDWKAKIGGWGGSRVATLHRLPEERPMTKGQFRYNKFKAFYRHHPIYNGWHFSYFGSNEAREAKLKSIKDTRNWETKVGLSYHTIARKVETVNEWNSVSRKKKLQAEPMTKIKLDPELEKLFSKYPQFFSNSFRNNSK